MISIITAPAVNAGAVKRNEPNNIKKIAPIIISRAEKILVIAAHHGVTDLVLGAWGCGVFKNDPDQVADIWFDHLENSEIFKGLFHRIVFTVPGIIGKNYQAFIERFRNIKVS
ncbi:MAG: TIGR02452 family protein [Promethearchaeota archaeon]